MKRVSLPLLSLLMLMACAPLLAQELASAKDYVKRGISRFGKGDTDAALSDFDHAIELNPRHAEAHLNRGKDASPALKGDWKSPAAAPRSARAGNKIRVGRQRKSPGSERRRDGPFRHPLSARLLPAPSPRQSPLSRSAAAPSRPPQDD